MNNARSWRPAAIPESVRNNGLTAFLILEALILFIAAPMSMLGLHVPLILGGVLCALLLLLLVIISRSPGARVIALIAAAMAVGGAGFRITQPSLVTVWLGHLAVIAAMFALSMVIAQVVFAPGRVTYHRIEGAVVLYLNIAVTFTSIYRLILELDPNAFAQIQGHQSERSEITGMLYFSFTTLTSTGFGEILPVNPFARSMANLESVLGQLYLAIMMARLVAMHLESRRN